MGRAIRAAEIGDGTYECSTPSETAAMLMLLQKNGDIIEQMCRYILCAKKAGILAILFGGLGMHKFYLGKYGQGLLCVAFCWTLIPAVIGIMQGVHYLTETQEQFEDELQPKKRAPKKAPQKTAKQKAKA